MHSCLPASWSTPARLALMTAVGPPDCPTKRFPTNSAINLRSRVQFNVQPHKARKIEAQTLPTDRASVKEELYPALPQFAELFADFVVFRLRCEPRMDTNEHEFLEDALCLDVLLCCSEKKILAFSSVD